MSEGSRNIKTEGGTFHRDKKDLELCKEDENCNDAVCDRVDSNELVMHDKTQQAWEPIAIRSTVLGNSGTMNEFPSTRFVSNKFKFIPNIKATQPLSVVKPLLPQNSSKLHVDTAISLTHSLSLRQVPKQQNAAGSFYPLSRTFGQQSKLKEVKVLPSNRVSEYDVWANRVSSTASLIEKEEKKKKKKSLRFHELSSIKAHSFTMRYAPITLPLRQSQYTDEKSSSVSERPTLKHIDESNRYAAEVFDYQNNWDNQDGSNRQFIFVQFPALLPPLDKYATTSQKTEEKYSANETSSSHCFCRLEGLPEGLLGTLLIHRSGRVVLRIGDHQFNVNQGSECSFAQEVAWLIPNNRELMFLGECSHRIVITPDLDKLS